MNKAVQLTHEEHIKMSECSSDVRTVELPLSGGHFALITERDYHLVARIKWCMTASGYVRGRWKKSIGGNGSVVYLHQFLMRAPSGMVVDHIDGNRLNNTRGNLQITTVSRNMMRAHPNGGVSKLHKSSRWRARLRVDGNLVSLGCYDTYDEALEALERVKSTVWNDDQLNILGTLR